MSGLPDPATCWTSQTIPSECRPDEYNEVAWGIAEYGGQTPKHVPMWIPRPKVTDFTVKYDLVYAGVCHSDCHTGTNDWFGCVYPCVLGHEHAGVVTEVGAKVTKVKVGDRVGVGCFIDACLNCKMCKRGDEHYCEKGMTQTYNSKKIHGRVGGNPDLTTFGGYSCSNVVHEYFVMKIPDAIPFEKAPPIFCAAITLYDPLRHWGATKDDRVKMVIGVCGIGGLGTMGIKIAKALGHTVVAVSRSARKEKMAKEKGADYYVATSDPKSVTDCPVKCDLILNTVGAKHDINVYMPLLSQDGTIVQLGGNVYPQSFSAFTLMMKRLKIAGSIIGGIKATEECLEFCAKHGIYPDIQLIEAKEIDWAWQQLIGPSGNKDGVRYVIDIKKSLENKDFLPKHGQKAIFQEEKSPVV